jgi:hypothetical protein
MPGIPSQAGRAALALPSGRACWGSRADPADDVESADDVIKAQDRHLKEAEKAGDGLERVGLVGGDDRRVRVQHPRHRWKGGGHGPHRLLARSA